MGYGSLVIHIFIFILYFIIFIINIYCIKYLSLNLACFDAKLTTYLLKKIVDQAIKIKKIYRPGNVPTAKSPDHQTSWPQNFWPPNSRPPNGLTAEYLTGACHSAESLTAELVPTFVVESKLRSIICGVHLIDSTTNVSTNSAVRLPRSDTHRSNILWSAHLAVENLAVGNFAVGNLAVKNFAVGTLGGQDFLRSGHFPVCIFFYLGGLINNFYK